MKNTYHSKVPVSEPTSVLADNSEECLAHCLVSVWRCVSPAETWGELEHH